MYTRLLSLRILAISVTRHISVNSEYGSYCNMAERGLDEIQCMYYPYRKHPMLLNEINAM